MKQSANQGSEFQQLESTCHALSSKGSYHPPSAWLPQELLLQSHQAKNNIISTKKKRKIKRIGRKERSFSVPSCDILSLAAASGSLSKCCWLEPIRWFSDERTKSGETTMMARNRAAKCTIISLCHQELRRSDDSTSLKLQFRSQGLCSLSLNKID